MPTQMVGEYEIEYAGAALPEGEGWGAYITIYGPSTNPMHRNPVFPLQHVAVETVFPNQAEAEAEALKVALGMIKHA